MVVIMQFYDLPSILRTINNSSSCSNCNSSRCSWLIQVNALHRIQLKCNSLIRMELSSSKWASSRSSNRFFKINSNKHSNSRVNNNNLGKIWCRCNNNHIQQIQLLQLSNKICKLSNNKVSNNSTNISHQKQLQKQHNHQQSKLKI